MAERIRIEFEGDMKQLRAELRKVLNDTEGTGTKGGKRFGSGFSQGFKDAFAGFTAANLATRGIDQAIGLVSTAFDQMLAKEQALADFSAITGITGEALDGFGDAAVRLSNKFGTDVLENIDAMKGLLSRLGPGIAQSEEALASMTDTVNVLSKASGLDATASMDALTTAMLQFGVDLSDPVAAAAEMAEMMNVMAAGAKEGAAEIPAISEALKQAGSTAKGLNISFEETNAAIQALAASGKFGSEAGVALRNVMVRLTSATGPAKQSLAKMGLTIEQLGDVVTTQGLEAGLELFNDGLKKVPNLAEQAAIKVNVFGTENLAAAGGILSVVESQGLLTDSLGDTTTAYDQAATNMATKSEMMKRAATNAMNTIVSGMEEGVNWAVERFGALAMQTDYVAGAFSQLMSLDLAGFWDTVTTSVADYNQEKERQLELERQNYEALIRENDAQQKQSARMALMAKLSKELNLKLLNVQKVTDDTLRGLMIIDFERAFKAGLINSIDEFFLRTEEGTTKVRKTLADLKAERDTLIESRGGLFEGDVASANALNAQIEALTQKINLLEGKKPKQKKEEKEAPLAGTLGALKAQAGEIENLIENKLQPNTAEFSAANDQLKELRTEIEYINLLLGEMPALPEFDLGLEEQDLQPLKDLPEDFDYARAAAESMISGIAAGFQGLGSAMAGGQDAAKETLKSIVSTFITAIQAELIASSAAAAAKGVTSFGLTLIKDAPLIATGWAALEVAKGYLNSLDVGGVLKTDQIIQAHAGETVIPPRDAPKYFAEAVHKGVGGTGSNYRKRYQRNRPERMMANMNVYVSDRPYQVRQSLRVG